MSRSLVTYFLCGTCITTRMIPGLITIRFEIHRCFHNVDKMNIAIGVIVPQVLYLMICNISFKRIDKQLTKRTYQSKT